MPHPELERFATEVQNDDALLARLKHTPDADAFAAEAAATGAERGYRFSAADVKAYLNEQTQEAELSDAELDQATGGLNLNLIGYFLRGLPPEASDGPARDF